MSQLTQDGDGTSLPVVSRLSHGQLICSLSSTVVVGRGKTGWNRLLGKPAVAAKEKVTHRHELQVVINARTKEERLMMEQRRWPGDERAEETDLQNEGSIKSRKEEKGKGKEVIVDDSQVEHNVDDCEEEDEDDCSEGATTGMFSGAGKFLLAGGLAGAGSSLSLICTFTLRA